MIFNNEQDLEDAFQDLAIYKFKTGYVNKPAHADKFFISRRASYMAKQQYKRALEAYKYFINFDNFYEMPVNTLENNMTVIYLTLNYVSRKEKEVILEFLKYGSLREVSNKLKKPYDTVKAQYRTAVIKLRKFTKGELEHE